MRVCVSVWEQICVVCVGECARVKSAFSSLEDNISREIQMALPPMKENGRMRSHYGRRNYGSFLFLQSNTTAKGTIQEMIQAFSTALISTVLGGQSANYSSGALEV